MFDLFDDGATVVLQGLHRYWQPLGALVAELELALGHPCQANAYLTPPGSQGFAVHSDSHDVFVFQTHGSKVWEVPRATASRSTVVLEPGVSMYLPTGTPHAARAQDTVSLHVTIGINQVTWKDVLDRALADALDDDRCRSTCRPATSTTRPCSPTASPSGWRPWPPPCAALDPAAVADAEVRRFLTGRTLWQRGGLRDRIAARDLTDTDRAAPPPRPPLRAARPRATGSGCCSATGSCVMPGYLAAGARRVVRDADALTPADLDLDEQSRLVLCRRLVREGLLEVVGVSAFRCAAASLGARRAG